VNNGSKHSDIARTSQMTSTRRAQITPARDPSYADHRRSTCVTAQRLRHRVYRDFAETRQKRIYHELLEIAESVANDPVGSTPHASELTGGKDLFAPLAAL
jgi:hypothetical protein